MVQKGAVGRSKYQQQETFKARQSRCANSVLVNPACKYCYDASPNSKDEVRVYTLHGGEGQVDM